MHFQIYVFCIHTYVFKNAFFAEKLRANFSDFCTLMITTWSFTLKLFQQFHIKVCVANFKVNFLNLNFWDPYIIHQSIYWLNYPFIHPSIHQIAYLSTHLSAFLSTYLFINLSIHHYSRSSNHPSVHIFLNPFINAYIHPSSHLSALTFPSNNLRIINNIFWLLTV